jgi:hypothetical protein
MVRQLHESLTAPTGHDDGNGAACELTDETAARNLPHFLHTLLLEDSTCLTERCMDDATERTLR